MLKIYDGTSKFLVNSITFAFAFMPIGPWFDPLAAFAFIIGHMEAPQCLHMFVPFPYIWNLSFKVRFHICGMRM